MPALIQARRRLQSLVGPIVLTSAILLVVELGLRLTTGGPHGAFLGWFPGRLGLYPENTTLQMPGPVNWKVRTNQWGFRGDDLSLLKTPGRTRIAMIGDSVTDGFGVDNEHTYPSMTRAGLEARGVAAEVINGASGGGTIDRELAILRDAVTRFAPDVVVLTFVTNDVDALESITDADLFNPALVRSSPTRSVLRAIAVRSAIGEWLFDAYLRIRFKEYRTSPKPARVAIDPGPSRYNRPGGDDFAGNSRVFLERFRNTDGRVIAATLDGPMEFQLQRYLRAWDAFMRHARSLEMRPVFVYFPAYPQVYDTSMAMLVRDILRAHSESQSVPFLDLTPSLRAHGGAVLHLAPADFHPNPDGNRVIGQALADFLVERGLVARSPR